jgi:hypothetical protein
MAGIQLTSALAFAGLDRLGVALNSLLCLSLPRTPVHGRVTCHNGRCSLGYNGLIFFVKVLQGDSLECPGHETSAHSADAGNRRVNVECIPGVGAQVALVHGFSGQDELLRLLEFCPKDIPVRILLPEGGSAALVVPILDLGLKNVEILSDSQKCLNELEPVVRVLQGAGEDGRAGLESLRFGLSQLIPGGCCSILIAEKSPADASATAAASALLDCLGRLSLWLAAGSLTLPPVPWGADVESIQFQPGLATICVRSASARDSSLISSGPELSTGFGCAAEVISEMQHEVNRVFDLYNLAYMRAQSLQFEVKELRRLLVGCQFLNLRYGVVLRKALDVLSRLAASSVD